MVMKSLKWIN